MRKCPFCAGQNQKVTLDTYGHLFPNLDEALAHGLDELARTSAASTPPADEVVVSLATG